MEVMMAEHRRGPYTRSASLKRPRESVVADARGRISPPSEEILAVSLSVLLRRPPRASSTMPKHSPTKPPRTPSPPSSSSDPSLPPQFLSESSPRGLKRPRPSAVKDPQPNPAYLTAVYGIKHRDFAYESTLPPVPSYRRQQLLDVDTDEDIFTDNVDHWFDDAVATTINSVQPTSPFRAVERSPPGGFSQSQFSQSQNSQRRRSLEREATEPAVDESSSQPRAIPPPNRGLGPRRQLFADYDFPSSQPQSQPQSQSRHTPPSQSARRATTPTSSPPQLLPSPISQRTGRQAQPADDEDNAPTPLITPNGSLLWPMDTDDPTPAPARVLHCIAELDDDDDAMIIDTSDLPASQHATLAALHGPEDDISLSQLGFSQSAYYSGFSQAPSPRTPPSHGVTRNMRSPLRRASPFVHSPLRQSRSPPETTPHHIPGLVLRSSRFTTPASPPSCRSSSAASRTASPRSSASGAGTPAHRPSPLSHFSPLHPITGLGGPITRERVASPPDFADPPVRSRVVSPAAEPSPLVPAAVRTPVEPRSYNLRKRPVTDSPGSKRSRKPLSNNGSAAQVPPVMPSPVPTPALTPTPTTPVSQAVPRTPRTARTAFTIRSAHAASEAAAVKAGRAMKEKSREAQQARVEAAARTSTETRPKRTLRTRKIG